MSRARDLLERFRPVGTPGPAGATGVPVDRARELAAELQPVFDALATTEAECAAVRAAAQAEAEARRVRAAERARGVLEAARRDTEAERTAAAAGGPGAAPRGGADARASRGRG